MLVTKGLGRRLFVQVPEVSHAACFDALAAARPFLSLPASQHRYSIPTLFLTFILFCPTMESIVTVTPDQPSFSSQIFSRSRHLRTSSEVYTAFTDKCQQFGNPSDIRTGRGTDSFEEVFEIAQATNYNEAMKSITKSKSDLGDGKKWFLEGCDFQVVGKGVRTRDFVMRMGRFEVGKVVAIERQAYVVRGVQEVGLDFFRYRLECEGQQESNFPGYYSLVVPDVFLPSSQRLGLRFFLRRCSPLRFLYRTLAADFQCSSSFFHPDPVSSDGVSEVVFDDVEGASFFEMD